MKKAIRTILLIVCICVFCYSAYNLINIYLNYKKIDDDYGELANTYTSVKDEKKEEQNYLQIDWATLKERNNDVKAWIQIPDTNVNYPVLQGETNDPSLPLARAERKPLDQKKKLNPRYQRENPLIL